MYSPLPLTNHIHILICEYSHSKAVNINLYGKRDFSDVIKDLEMGR